MCALSLLGCARRHAATSVVDATAATTVSLRPLTDGVWLHTSMRTLPEYGRIPSHGLVVQTGDELLLVDTAWGVEPTRELVAMIRRQFGRLPSAAIVTHAHDDRVGGLPVLRAEGVPVYATRETATRAAAQGAVIDHVLDAPVDRRALAGADVEVFAPGPAHTPDNVVVWLPARGVLFGGCMIRPAGSTALGNLADADLATWPASALRVAERYAAARVVVPSHGDPGDASLLAHTVDLTHASLTPAMVLRRAEQLPVRDDTPVTLCGTFVRVDVAQQHLARLRLVGDTEPRVSLDPPGDLDARNGHPVCVSGRFFHMEPLHPGDPPYASRRTGWWLMGARDVAAQ